MSVVDEFTLLERARRGDETAFSQLFTAYQRKIFRYAAYMCGREAGDDIVQETFLAVLRQTGRRDAPSGSVLGYLFGIARHLVWKRHAGSPDQHEDVTDAIDRIAAPEPTALERMTHAETLDAVRAAVQSLPAPYREAIVLCDLEEVDYASAAQAMQVPIGTVRSRVHRARALLATKLSAGGGPEGPPYENTRATS